MRRPAFLALILFYVLSVPAVAEGEVVHEATWATVDLEKTLPVDLTDPVGKTRWDVEGLASAGGYRRTMREGIEGELSIVDTRDLVGPKDYSATSRDWWLPHRRCARLQPCR